MILYERITRQAREFVRMLGDRILVTHYRRPLRYGRIELLPSEDSTNTYWEVLTTLNNAQQAEHALGVALTPGDILCTLRRWPEDTGFDTIEGHNVFALSLSAAGVRGVIKYDAATGANE